MARGGRPPAAGGNLALCSICLASRAVLELEDEQFVAAGTLLEEAIALSEEIGAPSICIGAGAHSVRPVSWREVLRAPWRAPRRR